MDKLQQIVSLLIALLAGVCFVIWAGWFNEDLDFIGIARHADKFPLGPDKGPLAFGFGGLFVAWLVYPGAEDNRKRR